MALLRKNTAGADSFGNVWPADGSVIEVNDADQVVALLAIPDAGITEFIPPVELDDEDDEDGDEEPAAEDGDADGAEDGDETSAEAAADEVVEAPKAPRGRARRS